MLEHLDGALDERRGEHVVGVEEEHVLARRLREPGAARRAEPGVDLGQDPGAVALGELEDDARRPRAASRR